MPATVYVTELMGSETLVVAELESQRIIARAAWDFRADPNTAIWIDLDLSRAHLFDHATGRRL
jgi:ABC-type sugar transport system ATPase subunit